MASAA
jgi:hypothetical protein